MKKNIKPNFFLVLLPVLFILLSGKCIEQVTEPIDAAVEKLEKTSADWQQVLKELEQNLVKDGQSTLSHEVNSIMQRGIAAAGVEFRCDADFVRHRVTQALKNLLIRKNTGVQPPSTPVFCHTIPAGVDASLIPTGRLKFLEFYGYDFDKTAIQVLLENGDSTVDVSRYLDNPGHYQMTLNLTTGIPLKNDSRRFILKWNNMEINSVAISPMPTPKPVKRKIKILGQILMVDDEVFSDETRTVNINNVEHSLDDANPLWKYNGDWCVGDEVRGELSINFSLNTSSGQVEVSGTSKYFEGTNCRTNDLQKSDSFSFNIPTNGRKEYNKVLVDGEGKVDFRLVFTSDAQ